MRVVALIVGAIPMFAYGWVGRETFVPYSHSPMNYWRRR